MQKSDERALTLRWTGRIALRHRILAVNIFALAILAGSLFYLDSFRSRLTQARVAQIESEATMIADMLAAVAPERRQALFERLGRDSGTRLRLYGGGGCEAPTMVSKMLSMARPRSRRNGSASGSRIS